MCFRRTGARLLAMAALAIAATASLHASTFQRASLDRLAAGSDSIVVGEVLGTHSYWGEGKRFILTDVNLEVSEVVKGNTETRQVVVTLLGGTVNDTTTLIVGGAVLQPGHSYLVFLGQADLPGAPAALTVRDHSQGVFEIVRSGTELRATSQALKENLVADERGETRAAGGPEGFELGNLLEQLRNLVNRKEGTR